MNATLNNFVYKTTISEGMIYYIPQSSRAPAIEPHRQDEPPILPETSRPAPKVHVERKPASKEYRLPPKEQRALDAQQIKPLLPELPVPKDCKYAKNVKFRKTAQGWMSVSQSWNRLFTVNEYLPPAQKMEDRVLLERMYEWFPKCRPGKPYASKRFSDVREMRRRFNQGMLGQSSVHSYEYKRDGDQMVVFSRCRAIGYYLPDDGPDAPPRAYRQKACPATYERIYEAYKKQNEIAAKFAEAVMLENQRIRLEDEQMKEEEKYEQPEPDEADRCEP